MSALRIAWLGHSTALLELDGVRLLTDPLLRSRIAHVRRVAGPADPHALRDIDAVLISHLHYDHLDVSSLRRLEPRPRILLPKGAGGFLRRRGFTVTDVSVGDEVRVGALTIHVTPATHEGRRHPFGRNAPAVGYLIVGSARVYFAGDTDLFDGMAELAPGLDVALLPIAGWGPRLPAGHMDPQLAGRALALLRPRVAIPIHWGTYRRIGMSRDASLLRAPAEEFAEFAGTLAPDVDVRIIQPGGELELP
jgi:L-ascorbate metabolism protein UlaG (beta-lactamase superfamily)